MKLEAAILSGGKSTRMGTEKGLIQINRVPMVLKVIRVVEQLEMPVMIIANQSSYERLGYRVHGDIIPGKGPAGGIHTALSHASGTHTLVMACDMPCIRQQVLQTLIDAADDEYDAFVAVYEGRKHPLCAIYDNDLCPVFRTFIQDDVLKLHDILNQIKVRYVPFDGRQAMNPFLNINTVSDLDKLKRSEK